MLRAEKENGRGFADISKVKFSMSNNIYAMEATPEVPAEDDYYEPIPKSQKSEFIDGSPPSPLISPNPPAKRFELPLEDDTYEELMYEEITGEKAIEPALYQEEVNHSDCSNGSLYEYLDGSDSKKAEEA